MANNYLFATGFGTATRNNAAASRTKSNSNDDGTRNTPSHLKETLSSPSQHASSSLQNVATVGQLSGETQTIAANRVLIELNVNHNHDSHNNRSNKGKRKFDEFSILDTNVSSIEDDQPTNDVSKMGVVVAVAASAATDEEASDSEILQSQFNCFVDTLVDIEKEDGDVKLIDEHDDLDEVSF